MDTIRVVLAVSNLNSVSPYLSGTPSIYKAWFRIRLGIWWAPLNLTQNHWVCFIRNMLLTIYKATPPPSQLANSPTHPNPACSAPPPWVNAMPTSPSRFSPSTCTPTVGILCYDQHFHCPLSCASPLPMGAHDVSAGTMTAPTLSSIYGLCIALFVFVFVDMNVWLIRGFWNSSVSLVMTEDRAVLTKAKFVGLHFFLNVIRFPFPDDWTFEMIEELNRIVWSDRMLTPKDACGVVPLVYQYTI